MLNNEEIYAAVNLYRNAYEKFIDSILKIYNSSVFKHYALHKEFNEIISSSKSFDESYTHTKVVSGILKIFQLNMHKN